MLLPDIAGLAILAAVFIPLERLFPVDSRRPLLRRSLPVDGAHFLVSGVLIKLGMFALLAAALMISSALMPDNVGATVRAQPIWLQVVEAVIIADIVVYGVHRAFHEIPALWRFHAIHHSSDELDWMSAFRVHPVDQILTKGLSVCPLIVLGFSGEAMALFTLAFFWHAALIHSNAKIPFGPLKYLVTSPQFHHWHHANHPDALDKNFASQLSILDHLFGTAHLPGGNFPDRYGTDTPVPRGYLGQLAFPLPSLQRDR
jgi:sterol desaturase/sphingolipid hydroxylase (fatty acid hydroxylase superfamily)